MTWRKREKDRQIKPGRPRIPDDKHVVPTQDELAAGQVFTCHQCLLEWSLRFRGRPGGKYCGNCERSKRRMTHGRREQNRANFLRKRYGISVDDFNAMFAKQSGRCATCNVTLIVPTSNSNIGPAHAVIDHCHDTGLVRGILCSRCNVALGHARDVPSVLRAMADYVERHLALAP